MAVGSSENVKRVQQIVETLEEKKLVYDRALSTLNRTKIAVEESIKNAEDAVEKARNALDQTRLQLETELVKLDPALFVDRRAEV